jgi:glycosyltransferase involved in cell wall biosynthesis
VTVRSLEDIRPVDAVLLLLTDSYPYLIANEETFIEPQLDELAKAFHRVILVPSRTGGERARVPADVDVDERLAIANEAGGVTRLFRSVTSRLLWSEVRREWRRIPLSPAAIRRLLGSARRAESARDWFMSLGVQIDGGPIPYLAYTFWLDHSTVGLAAAKSRYPDLTVVSRINGGDIIEEHHHPPYLPFRRSTLRSLDRVYAVSEFGKRYLVQHYPWFEPRCQVSRLGVPDPGFITPARQRGVFVIASCSAVIAIKRVPLIAESVAEAAAKRPRSRFEWHHFGSGDQCPTLEAWVRSHMPSNVAVSLHGHTLPSQIMTFYRDTGVGAFLNASRSEGGCPVAIQEAASCSIPIIATNVGGNAEIVSDANGTLVTADPSPSDFGDAIVRLVDHPEEAGAKGAASRRIWDERFRADRNYREFAMTLRSLMEST